jgi:hypothetical protein
MCWDYWRAWFHMVVRFHPLCLKSILFGKTWKQTPFTTLGSFFFIPSFQVSHFWNVPILQILVNRSCHHPCGMTGRLRRFAKGPIIDRNSFIALKSVFLNIIRFTNSGSSPRKDQIFFRPTVLPQSQYHIIWTFGCRLWKLWMSRSHFFHCNCVPHHLNCDSRISDIVYCQLSWFFVQICLNLLFDICWSARYAAESERKLLTGSVICRFLGVCHPFSGVVLDGKLGIGSEIDWNQSRAGIIDDFEFQVSETISRAATWGDHENVTFPAKKPRRVVNFSWSSMGYGFPGPSPSIPVASENGCHIRDWNPSLDLELFQCSVLITDRNPVRSNRWEQFKLQDIESLLQ